MIKPFFLLAFLILLHPDQDAKVLTYSSGVADTESYERLSFWIKSSQRAYIRYARGREEEDVELSWGGADSLNGHRGFRLRFPGDTLDLVVIPQGTGLDITDRRGRYRKAFHWENENGTGDSTCSICASDEKQAMGWLKKYFF